MVSCRAIIGNLVNFEKDSFDVVFDKPVKVLGTSINDGVYMVTDNPMAYDNGTRYRWPFPGGRAGIDIDCTLTIQSQSDLTTTKSTIKIPLYEKKYVINAEEVISIHGSCLSFDKKSLWLTLISGYKENNKLIQLSLDDFSVMKSIDLPFVPNGLCLNPYNGLLYILPYIKDLYLGYSDYLCVVNPESGKLVKTIKIEQSPYAHQQFPTNYPSSLAFTRDGFGIIILRAAASTDLEWRYIDSADNDKITLIEKNDFPPRINTVYHNYDYSRIYATTGNYFTLINWFDRQHKNPGVLKLDGRFNSTEYYAGGNLETFAMSPYANKVFISASPCSHCVVNLDPVGYSKVCIEESRDSRSVWDGLVSDRDYVYQVCGYSGLQELFDMTKGDIIFATKHTFIMGSDQDLVACHFLPDTDQLLVTSLTSVTLLDAADMKRRSQK